MREMTLHTDIRVICSLQKSRVSLRQIFSTASCVYLIQ